MDCVANRLFVGGGGAIFYRLAGNKGGPFKPQPSEKAEQSQNYSECLKHVFHYGLPVVHAFYFLSSQEGVKQAFGLFI
ncbi:hypothetical protein KCP74_05045 [Salmonella enterica subsp. enterica]|nr:hypothetical protein KCP74_05045 [Salmonella enterica subsp. enterica]